MPPNTTVRPLHVTTTLAGTRHVAARCRLCTPLQPRRAVIVSCCHATVSDAVTAGLAHLARTHA